MGSCECPLKLIVQATSMDLDKKMATTLLMPTTGSRWAEQVEPPLRPESSNGKKPTNMNTMKYSQSEQNTTINYNSSSILFLPMLVNCDRSMAIKESSGFILNRTKKWQQQQSPICLIC